MTKETKSKKETEVVAKREKLANLKHKQMKCASDLGIARYARMIHALERELTALA